MPKRTIKQDVTEDPRYHDTWRLLKKYRDVVWSLELDVYKRQAADDLENFQHKFRGQTVAVGADELPALVDENGLLLRPVLLGPVSYTHLQYFGAV